IIALRSAESSERETVEASKRSHLPRSHTPTLPRSNAPTLPRSTTDLIHMHFLGATRPTQIVGLEQLPGKVNYLLGNDAAEWRRGVSTFAKVRYEQIYPGVDLVCHGSERQLEYDFLVAPGTNPESISLGFEGINDMEIDPQGDLILHTSGRQIR